MSAEGPRIARESVVVVGQNQVSADLTVDVSGQAVILELKEGVYYELNDVGAYIWKLIQEPRSVQAVLDSLLSRYDVSTRECETDLIALLENLSSRGLIEIRNG